MLHVAACLWDHNSNSQRFSLCYDQSWVEKLYRGFRRNLSMPFRFVLFTDRLREFREPIEQELLSTKAPHYGCLIEPFKLNVPTMICGLDMVVVRNIDHMAQYCLSEMRLGLLQHPTKKDYGFINPIAFVPAGHRAVFDDWRGENDMEWLRHRGDAVDVSKLWPNQIQSYKLHNVMNGSHPPEEARIIYMHGSKKSHEIDAGWVREHWK